jgi:methylphosphotriester-DNA--protein-cysteine methyltransferase
MATRTRPKNQVDFLIIGAGAAGGRAAQALREENTPISRLAERSGYESEAAFSRAFKREFGMAPSAWRATAAA